MLSIIIPQKVIILIRFGLTFLTWKTWLILLLMTYLEDLMKLLALRLRNGTNKVFDLYLSLMQELELKTMQKERTTFKKELIWIVWWNQSKILPNTTVLWSAMCGQVNVVSLIILRQTVRDIGWKVFKIFMTLLNLMECGLTWMNLQTLIIVHTENVLIFLMNWRSNSCLKIQENL